MMCVNCFVVSVVLSVCGQESGYAKTSSIHRKVRKGKWLKHIFKIIV